MSRALVLFNILLAELSLGFGLYIVHKIAAAHGATCSQDTTGGEATYTIRWPR